MFIIRRGFWYWVCLLVFSSHAILHPGVRAVDNHIVIQDIYSSDRFTYNQKRRFVSRSALIIIFTFKIAMYLKNECRVLNKVKLLLFFVVCKFTRWDDVITLPSSEYRKRVASRRTYSLYYCWDTKRGGIYPEGFNIEHLTIWNLSKDANYRLYIRR